MSADSPSFSRDDHTVDVLEFSRVLADLEALALSQDGIRALRRQPVLTSEPDIADAHRKIRHVLRLFDLDLTRPKYGFPDLTSFLDLLDVEGTSLEGPALKSIADYLRATSDLRRFLTSETPESGGSPLEYELGRLREYPELERYLRRHIDEDGSVREDLPSISRVLSRTRRLRETLQQTAKRYLHDRRDLWQSDVPTIKDDRTVLPLKTDHRGSVRGIVREVSPSGATLYIEPDDIVEGNNELSMLHHEYAVEVARVLRECTGEVRNHLHELEQLTEAVGTADSLYARARYGEQIGGVTPEGAGESLGLSGARHPMLGRKAVPIDVVLPEGARILIVTGPNAGGKTVTLKTIGLFALLHQFGVPLPADEDSRLPVFDGVFADIGDEQSIDESLSTFSGHMKHISRYVREASARSLVLLDELGSGTDPEEGSAIAMAVLDTLIERGCTVVVTTHHNVLKNYGYTHEEAVNASVSFDTDTHRPTYRVIMGLPGESHAFDIAETSGLPQAIVDKAHRYLDERSTDVASMIRAMSEKERELERRHVEFDEKKKALAEKQREVDLHALRLRQRELELRTQGYRELTKQMEEHRRELEGLVKQLKDQGSVDREKTREVKSYIDRMEETARREKREIEEEQHDLRPVTEIRPGMQVYVGKTKQLGTVVRKAKGNSWLIETDRLRVTVPEHEVRGVAEERPEPTKVRVQKSVDGPPPAFQLDLRGKRLDEAVAEVESHIDRCLLSGLNEFEIIHGHGEGVLKRGIRDFLSDSPAVSSFDYAHPDQGGFGKTVVKLAEP